MFAHLVFMLVSFKHVLIIPTRFKGMKNYIRLLDKTYFLRET